MAGDTDPKPSPPEPKYYVNDPNSPKHKLSDDEEECLASAAASVRRSQRAIDDLFPELASPVDSPLQQRMLNAYILCGQVKPACRKARISHVAHYRWMRLDPTYREAFERARVMAGDLVEDEAMRRAVDGWEEPVFFQGQVVGHITRYDGTLLVTLLKGFKPGTYHTKVDVTSGGKALGVFLSPEAQEAI